MNILKTIQLFGKTVEIFSITAAHLQDISTLVMAQCADEFAATALPADQAVMKGLDEDLRSQYINGLFNIYLAERGVDIEEIIYIPVYAFIGDTGKLIFGLQCEDAYASLVGFIYKTRTEAYRAAGIAKKTLSPLVEEKTRAELRWEINHLYRHPQSMLGYRIPALNITRQGFFSCDENLMYRDIEKAIFHCQKHEVEDSHQNPEC